MKTKFSELEKLATKYILDSLVLEDAVLSLEYYPEFPSKKNKGWHFTHPSPFIHANVLFSLLKSTNEETTKLTDKLTSFLIHTKEKGDLWRFWALNNCEHPVPPDIDDTSICSFVLEKKGLKLNNKKILFANINKDQRFFTWIRAKPKLLLFDPSLYFYLSKSEKFVLPTLKSGMFAWDDSEPAVSINTIMYLHSKFDLEKYINQFIQDWLENDLTYQFYDQEIVLIYHIARCFNEGVDRLALLKDDILEKINNSFEGYSFPELLIASISLNYFKIYGVLADKIQRLIEKNLDVLSPEDLWQNYPYFTSKDRIFYAGSPVLTASWIIEFIYAQDN